MQGKITILNPKKVEETKVNLVSSQIKSSITVIESNSTTATTTTQPSSLSTPGNRPNLVQIVDDESEFTKMSDQKKKIHMRLSTSRLNQEEKQVQEAFDKGTLKKDEVISFKPVMKNGMKDLYEWELIVKGKPGTIWEGGAFKIMLFVPWYFPERPPRVKFIPPPGRDRFQHVHVYGDGKLCLDLIDAKVFRSDVNFVQIAEAIYNIVHRDPNINSPANLAMNEIYQKDKAQYEAIIREQASVSKW